MDTRVERWERVGRWLICALLLAGLGMLQAGPMAWAEQLTQVTDTVRGADGTAQQGTVLISWPAFTTASGQSVAKGSTSVVIGAGGALSVQLAPNVGATPIGTYYTVVYHLTGGGTTREYWVVPVSGAAVTVASLRSSVLPTSVAMQTVSKQYVDQAIARALVAVPNSDPSIPYVEKVGDTMTGPLILSGDPTQALQAATKSYVDAGDTALQAGLAQKVSMVPTGNQTVTQPAGTKLEVNRLNGELNVGQFKSGSSSPDGIANTTAQTDCASGCDAVIERDYAAIDRPSPNLPTTTHVTDRRGGVEWDYFVNPHNGVEPAIDAGERVTVVHTEGAHEQKVRTGGSQPYSRGMWVNHFGLSGGNNIFPEQVTSSPPYFKSTYTAQAIEGVYNTQGQHVLTTHYTHCYGVGDCILGGNYLYSVGGYRDSADEGSHPYDFYALEDSAVFQGVCQTGCTTGSTQLTVSATRDAGTQGDGRFLINTTAAKVISSGVLVSGDPNATPFPRATFTGTNFPVSTMLQTAEKVQPRTTDIAPGTVTISIATSGVTAGYATNTLALPATSGVACVVDATPGFAFNPTNYEMANYQVVDGTHVQLTLNKPHDLGATISVGGLCGYGVEQTVDTAAGIRQVFPIVGSLSSTVIQYAAGHAPLLGLQGLTSGYLNAQYNITSIARSGGTVTVQLSSDITLELNGLQLTVSGVTDSSYNGTFAVTQTGLRTLTYTQAGANSTSLGGSIGILTGGFKMYPMAEVLSVMNAATKAVDGTMTLGANTVAWAANDTVEEPHYFLTRVAGDFLFIGQQMPRPTTTIEQGVQYLNLLGPGATGYRIVNGVASSQYLGYGGTHNYPSTGISVEGIWNTGLSMTAGESTALRVNCKVRGCGKWNSAYNLMSLQSNAGTDTVAYDPLTSTLTFGMRGTQYTMSPSAFTAGTINATTINASAINGLPVASSTVAGTVMMPVGSTGNQLGTMAAKSTANGCGLAGTDASGNVQCAMGVTYANGSAMALKAATSAAAGTAVPSPLLGPCGNTWNGSGGVDDCWSLQASYPFGTGTNPTSVLDLVHTGSTGTPVFRLPANTSVTNQSVGLAQGLCASGLGTITSCANNTVNTSFSALSTMVETVTFSATPVFSKDVGNSRMVLSGNVTSSTLAAGTNGQRKCINLVQDATGGRSFVWPTNVLGGMTVGTSAGKRNQQCFVYYTADSAWLAESAGVVNQ